MNKIIIEESNMKFGPYDKEAVFLIEQSRVYKEIGNNVKIAEFVLEKSSQNQALHNRRIMKIMIPLSEAFMKNLLILFLLP